MHGCHFLTTQDKNVHLPELWTISLIFSGLCHDLNHTGFSNLFEINSLSKLARMYNDKSVDLIIHIFINIIFFVI